MVRVYDTEQEFIGERLFVVQSHHLKNGKIVIRFGTKQQLYNLLNQYQYSVVEYKNEYEIYMNHLSTLKLFK